MSELRDPQPASKETAAKLREMFSRDGIYAIENYSKHGNIHRTRYVEGGAVKDPQSRRFEWVEVYFVDYDGQEWEGLKAHYLEGFTE